MKYTLIIAFLSLFVLNISGSIGKYPIQNFTPVEYQAGNQNIDFAQNRNKNIFVANNLGVLSYNGNEWKRHAFRTGKKKRSLAFDESTNRLYVGLQGEFGFFEDDWNYVSLVGLIPATSRDFDEVWDVFLSDDNVYFCTFQGIYIYDGQTISVLKHEDGLNRSFFANGKIFTQSQNGQLFEIKDHVLHPTYKQNQKNQIIAGVIPDEEGYLLFYNSGQIELSTPFDMSTKYESLIQALQGAYVNHVLQLSDSRLAISTQTAGLFLYNTQDNSIEIITTEEGLQTNACLRSFQDYTGNLWIGMQNGIALVNINSPLRLISREANIQGSGYEAFQTEKGTYFTTSNGIYFQLKGDKKSMFLKGTEGPAYGLQVIAGKLYAGHHTGLFILDNGSAFKLANTDGLWQIKQMKSNPEYAIAGTYSGLFLFKINENKIFQGVQKIKGFNESSRFFEEDEQGRIVVGQYYKGIYRLQLNEDFTQVTSNKFPNKDNFPIEEQIVLTQIDNELYIASNEGLYKIDQSNDRIVDAGLFSEVIGKQPVYLVEQDKLKNIHVVAENLIGYFKRISTNNYTFIPSSLYQLRYFFNNDLLNISINMDNGIMFSSNEGFIHYEPNLEERIGTDESIIVSEIYNATQDTTLYLSKPFNLEPETSDLIVIPPGSNMLEFNVESFQYDGVKNKQFRYFLKGFNEGYGEWTQSSTKEFTNLREGDYEFFAQTRNYLGEISASQSLLLKVKPPFHRSVFAKILYVVLGILSLFLIARLQKSRYKLKVREVEISTKHELDKKEKELLQVEQQKEIELQKLEEDNIKSELHHINNLLAASTMNLVVKNEFIETIKQKLKEVNRKGKNTETKQALQQIVKEIDFKLRLQEDWEQFEHHFDQVHGDFLTRLRNEFVELSPNEQKLSALLRLNLNTKEIANLMSISHRGVEVARYRLRKKLELLKGENLSKFILEY